MTTVLITGCAGFIGNHLCRKYLDEGYNVIGIDNFITSLKENVQDLVGNPNFLFIEGNIEEISYNNLNNLDLILHFASPASPKQYKKYPISTLNVNSIGTHKMLELAKINKARFFYASTSEVYGDPLEIPQKEEYWGNVNPVGVRSVYDEGKRFGEAISGVYRGRGVDVTILRIFNTYGPGMSKEDGRVIPNFINQCLDNKDITIYGDGKQIRCFTYITDLIECIYKLSIKKIIANLVYNIGNPERYTIKQLAYIVKEQTKGTSNIIYKPLPQDDPKIRIPNIERIQNEINWKPKIKLKEGLIKTINYYLS